MTTHTHHSNHSNHSNTDNLIRMANQIGDFFESMQDRQEGLEGIATHLQKYWTTPMRTALLAQIDNANMKPIVQETLGQYRNTLV